MLLGILLVLEFILLLACFLLSLRRKHIIKDMELITKDINKLGFMLSGSDTACNIIEILGCSDESLTEEQKLFCRAFCNELSGKNMTYSSLMLCNLIQVNNMESLLPNIIVNNIKFIDGKKNIDNSLNKLRSNKLFDSNLWNDFEVSMQKDLDEIKHGLIQ